MNQHLENHVITFVNGDCEGTGINPSNCLFLKKYKEQLEQLDFTKLYTKCDILSSNIKRIERFEEEPIIVFLVYESYKNECSERGTILSVLNNHNIPIEELKYPIKENYLQKFGVIGSTMVSKAISQGSIP